MMLYPDLIDSETLEWTSYLSENLIPAAAVSYSIQDQFQSHVYGQHIANSLNPTSITRDTVFEAGSLSKTLVSYLIYQLEQTKKLLPHTPLLEQLKNDQQRDALLIDLKDPISRKRAQTITYEMILSHCAGFDAWRAGGPLTINREPHTTFYYSGEGYLFLQRFLEIHLNDSIDNIVEHTIFKPIGMSHSSFSCPSERMGQIALGHDRLGQCLVKFTQPKTVIAGSLHTTVRDYSRFIQFLLTSQRRSEQYFLWIQGIVNPTQTPGVHWCQGWGTLRGEDSRPSQYFWHWGDTGGYHCFVIVNSQTKDFITYFTNSQSGLRLLKHIIHCTNFQLDSLSSNTIEQLIGSVTNQKQGVERYWFDYDKLEPFYVLNYD